MDDQRRQDLKRRASAAKPATPTKPTPPLNAELEKAKSLIQQKQYDDARALLVTIDDPVADKWLARLEQIAPAARPATTPQPEVIVRPPRKMPLWLKLIGGVVVILAALFVVQLVLFKQWEPKLNARLGVFRYCQTWHGETDCSVYADDVLARSEAQVLACQAEWDGFDYPVSFAECLEESGVVQR
jgi:hypothetical protein